MKIMDIDCHEFLVCLIEIIIWSLTQVIKYTAGRGYAADQGNMHLVLLKLPRPLLRYPELPPQHRCQTAVQCGHLALKQSFY